MPAPWYTQKSPDDLRRIAREYIDSERAKELPPTYNGLCCAWGVTLRTVQNYLAGDERADDAPPDFLEAVADGMAQMDAVIEQGMYTKGNNPAGFLFALKNRGWRDVQEINSNVRFTDLRAVFGDVLTGQIASNPPQVAVPSKANNIPDAVLIDSKPAPE